MNQRAWILTGIGLVVVGGALGVGLQYRHAQRDIAFADGAINRNHLRQATVYLNEAQRSWPLMSTVAQRHRVTTEKAGDLHFKDGLVEMAQGKYSVARSDFAAVPNSSVHYHAARMELHHIAEGRAEVVTAERFVKQATVVANAINTFWTDFNGVTNTFNTVNNALYSYFGSPPSGSILTAVNGAQTLTNDASTMQTDVQNLTEDLSSITQTPPWTHLPANGLLNEANLVSQQENTLANDFTNDATSFSNGNTVSFTASNAVITSLDASQVAYNNDLSAVTGSVIATLRQTLGNSPTLAALLGRP